MSSSINSHGFPKGRHKVCSIVTATAVMLGVVAATTNGQAADVSKKVVLANLDRNEFTFRVGKVQKKITSKKASVLSPKKYPITLEIWSGNNKLGWQKQTFETAGVYVLRYQNGLWRVDHRRRVRPD